MQPENHEQTLGRRSALIYLPIALGVALAFFLAASATGDFSIIARLGGAVWVGLLSLIVAMPIVTTQVKRSQRQVNGSAPLEHTPGSTRLA